MQFLIVLNGNVFDTYLFSKITVMEQLHCLTNKESYGLSYPNIYFRY